MDRPIRAAAAAAVLIASLPACAGHRGATFRDGTPVEVEKNSRGLVSVASYKQAGEVVNMASLLAGLESNEASRGDARAAKTYALGAVLLAGAGGAGLGYALASGLSGHDLGWTVTAASAGVIGIGFGLEYLSVKRLGRAVEAYNVQRRATASLPSVAPWAASVDGAQGRCLVGGLALRF